MLFRKIISLAMMPALSEGLYIDLSVLFGWVLLVPVASSRHVILGGRNLFLFVWVVLFEKLFELAKVYHLRDRVHKVILRLDDVGVES